MARPWAWPHTTLWGSTRGRISTRQPWRPAVDEPSADTRARVWASSLRPLPRHARARQQLVRTSQVLTLGAHRYPCYSTCARGAPASPPMWGGFIRPPPWEGVGGLGGCRPASVPWLVVRWVTRRTTRWTGRMAAAASPPWATVAQRCAGGVWCLLASWKLRRARGAGHRVTGPDPTRSLSGPRGVHARHWRCGLLSCGVGAGDRSSFLSPKSRSKAPRALACGHLVVADRRASQTRSRTHDTGSLTSRRVGAACSRPQDGHAASLHGLRGGAHPTFGQRLTQLKACRISHRWAW